MELCYLPLKNRNSFEQKCDGAPKKCWKVVQQFRMPDDDGCVLSPSAEDFSAHVTLVRSTFLGEIQICRYLLSSSLHLSLRRVSPLRSVFESPTGGFAANGFQFGKQLV